MKVEQLIKEMLLEGESERLEFIESVRKEEIAKVLCSFLNGKGGRILVGVSEDKIPFHIQNSAKWVDDLKIYLLNVLLPEAPVTISVEPYHNNDLILLKVSGGSKQPYLFDGNIYYRKGVSTVKATPQQISELLHDRQKSELHWERQPAFGVDLEDLDKKLIQQTIKESREYHRSIFEGNDILNFLTNYGLYKNSSFTNACVVLFAKTPSRFLPQIRVRLTEYGEGKTYNALLRDEVFEGNLFDIQDKLERYFGNLGTRSVFDKNQWRRIDFRFPEKALQEGVINALMHRDYSSPSSGVAISIFPESFVISNSGHLPDDLKVSELKKNHRSHPVNPDIAHVVFMRGLIDKLGKGTIKVVEECRKEGLKDPSWKDDIDGITLTFNGPKALAAKKRTSKTDGVNDGLIDGLIDGVNTLLDDGVNDGLIDGVNDGVRIDIMKITELVLGKEGVNAMDIATKRGKSKPSIERYLRIAKEVGIIEFKGAPKTGGYYLTENMKAKLR
ncbi:MAG: putative DNA binding domain-containing protein [Bacteroidales bacterium]|nr:putative DNA binding domain-containing protein [Bacteroidales bacterium]MCF8455504.1 putative DNA binding domain-containing protein [Bacteroidales bacterium]